MKRLISSAILSLLSAMILAQHATAQTSQNKTAVRGQFLGAWRLVALDEQGPDGKPRRCDCSGMFVFTPDGHAAVQVLTRGTAGAVGSSPYSQGGYEASFGTYVVDERARTFTFHIEGALVRKLMGTNLPRRYEFSGRRLIVRPTSPSEHWSVTWERY